MSDAKSTELESVKFITSISMSGLATTSLKAGNSLVRSLTLLPGFVRVETNKGTMLVPLANVAFVVPAVAKEEVKK